jgi:hypothetical protein
MSRKHRKNRCGDMNAIGIDQHRDLAPAPAIGWHKYLGEHQAKQGMILVGAFGPIPLAAHPVDESCPRALLIVTRSLN